MHSRVRTDERLARRTLPRRRGSRATYRFGAVLAATGATRSQLIHWTNVRLVTPDVTETTGPGHQRVFSFQNLVEVRVAVFLAGYSISVRVMNFILRIVRRALRQMRRTGNRDRVLRIPGGTRDVNTVWDGTIGELADELRQPVGPATRAGLVVELGGIVTDLEAATGDHL